MGGNPEGAYGFYLNVMETGGGVTVQKVLGGRNEGGDWRMSESSS